MSIWQEKLLTGSFYDDESKVNYLFDSKSLELEAVTYIRGRSLRGSSSSSTKRRT